MRRGRAIRLMLVPLAASLGLAGWGKCALAQPMSTPPVATDTPRERLIPLEISINNTQAGSWTLLEQNGVLYAPADAFEEWRLNRRPGAAPISYRGQQWYALGSVPGFEVRVNLANQSMDLVFSPSAFAATRINSDSMKPPELSPVEPALFLNYDLNLSYTKPRGAKAAQELGAVTELGYSSRFGVLTSSYVARNLNEPDASQPRSVRRLETAFTRDFLENNLSLRLGDGTTRVGLLGRGIFFGGVQISRNFALTPGFITQPIPLISGTSNAPSTVELYVNDVLRQTSTVPTGPFVIDNFPLLTGAGQARLVVRDLLGRETVIVQPFFSSANLLAPGLSDWSIEAGAVRLNLGTDNANYGEKFATGMWRYGASRAFTIETRGELSPQTQGAGAGITYALPLQMLGVAALTASNREGLGRGLRWLAGVEYESLRHGFTARAEGASRRFRQIGQEDASLPNRLEFSASYSYNSENFGSLGLGMARIQSYERGALTTLSAQYSMRLGSRSALSFSATRVNGPNPRSSLGVSLTVPLDGNITVAGNVTHRAGKTDAYASAGKGLAAETGLGWRTVAGVRENAPYTEGGLYYQGNKTLLMADASVSSRQQALRLGAQGALVFIDGKFFSSRRLDSSFALVEVPGYPGVGVGFQGSTLTRTDADGVALLSRLVPHYANSIRLDPTELPINAELDSIELVAVPATRSGVKVTFPVRSGRGALIRIVLDDGDPAPAGAEVELVGDKKEFFVARRGESFVTGLLEKNTLRLKWKDAACSFEVALPPGNIDEIARVGPLKCSGVKR